MRTRMRSAAEVTVPSSRTTGPAWPPGPARRSAPARRAPSTTRRRLRGRRSRPDWWEQGEQHLAERFLGLPGGEPAVEPQDPPRRGVTDGDDLGQPASSRRPVVNAVEALGEGLPAPAHVVAAAAGGELRHTGRLPRLGVELEDQRAVILVVADQRVQRGFGTLPNGGRTVGGKARELALDRGGEQSVLRAEAPDHRLHRDVRLRRDVLEPDAVVRDVGVEAEHRVDDPLAGPLGRFRPGRHPVRTSRPIFHASNANLNIFMSVSLRSTQPRSTRWTSTPPPPAAKARSTRAPPSCPPGSAGFTSVSSATDPRRCCGRRCSWTATPGIPCCRCCLRGAGTPSSTRPDWDSASPCARPATSPAPPTRPATCSSDSAWTGRSTGSATRSAGTSDSSSPRDPGCSAVSWPSAHRPSRSTRRCAGGSRSCSRSFAPQDPWDRCARQSSRPCSPTPLATVRLCARSWRSPWRAPPAAAWPWPSGPSSSTGSMSLLSSQTSPSRASSWRPTTAATGVRRIPRLPPPWHPTPWQ